MIFVLDKTGRLLYANHMVGRRLGYTPAELADKQLIDFHPPQRRQEAINVFSQILAGQTSLCEVPLLKKDGSQIPVETVVAQGKWGEIDAIFGVSRDLSELHRARQALQESETRFRAIFESAAVGFVLGNLQGIMVEVNGAHAKMLGYSPSELIGNSYTDYTHPDDVVTQEALIKDMFEGKLDKILLEKRYIHKNGGLVWGRLNLSVIHDTEGRTLYGIGIIENITERKQAGDLLRENEALLRNLFENLPDFVILVDQNAKIIFANHDAPGVTKEEMIGRDGFSFVQEPYRSKCKEAFNKSLSTRTVQEVESYDIFGHFWSATVVPFADHDAVGQLMVICTDITQQKQSVEAIQKEQQLLRRIIDLHERNRQATAYEIHDGVTQQITAALLHLEACRRQWNSDVHSAEKSLETSIRLIEPKRR